MQIVKPSKGSDCYRCSERINSGELRFKTKAGYMHLHCKKRIEEIGIGNYCTPEWLGGCICPVSFNDGLRIQLRKELINATRLEF